ncbi:MAG: serine hydrolase [Rhodospirillales bacterium]|jgi:D-alanyl-D-alanine carboxypeptidase|nr:serine hydrolase [Rhodospirillales bacterium]
MKLPVVLLVACTFATPVFARDLTDAERARIDRTVETVLAETSAPAASIALVLDGQIAYAKAYGAAKLSPRVPATADMRFPIGSVSKQFTAAAILRLREQGKIKLDDKVSQYVPEIEHGAEITVHQLLDHTSGLRDYWPQDFMIPPMREPTTPMAILQRWATGALDFAPGTDWQYSNTGFVAAGVASERISGKPLFQQLQEGVFAPLGMTSVIEASVKPSPDVAGYTRYALGPVRAAEFDRANWMYAAGGLAMTASDLARWDISLIDRSLLKPDSYEQMFTTTRLASGKDTNYGLGVMVNTTNGRKTIAHGGEVTGFLTQNSVYPDEHAAIVVMVNTDGSGSPQDRIADRLAGIVLPVSAKDLAVREFFDMLRTDKFDRSRLTPYGGSYFTAAVIADYRGSLAKFGEPDLFKLRRASERGGLDTRSYTVRSGERALNVLVRMGPNEKIEQFSVGPLPD